MPSSPVLPAADDLMTIWQRDGGSLNEEVARFGVLAGLLGVTFAANKVPVGTGAETFGLLTLDTDNTLGANSDTRLATQKALKAYVDAAVTGVLTLKGSTDCSGNPNYPAAVAGDSYIVSVAGKIGGGSGKVVGVGDLYAASADNAGGTEAGVGASWFTIPHTIVGGLLIANNLSDLANAATAVTNLFGAASTGTGGAVRTTSPTLVTPTLGVAVATSINGNTVTTGTGTLTLGAGKTLTASNTLTLTATDGSTLAVGAGGTLGSAAYTASSAYEVAGAAAAAQAASQPLDADLTAIAALSTTSFGRGGLTQADAAAFRSYIGVGTGSGDALVANPLSQFAATTSLQLKGVLSDETGSGALVFATTPTLVTPILGTPTSGNLANCTFPTLNQSTTGGAAYLTTPRNINGVPFDGTGDVTVTAVAAAGSLTGGTLAAGVLASSLTSLGTIASLVATTAAISAGTVGALTSFGVRSTGAAFDLKLASSEALTANRTLSIVLGDTARTLTLGASPSVSGSNTGDQTTVSGNAGTATALQTARTIYGNSFDGTAALAQVIASTYGGTGNGFTKFSGPTTPEKTFTLPDASAAVLTDNAAVTVAQGGTGRATSTTAYALIAAGTTATGAHQTLAAGATTEILVGGGAGALPVWTTASGSGAPARVNSPTFVTPALGTPGSGNLANCTFPTLNQSTTGSAASLTTPRAINGVNFDGTAAITVTAAAGTLTGATLNSTVTASSLTSFGAGIALGTPASGTLTNCTFPTLNQSTTGSAASLTTPRAINGTNFDGTAAITVTAAAGTLTGTTLNATVVSSSLTSTGTLTGGATGAGFTVALGTSTVTGTLGIGNGGTGQITAYAAFDALSIHGADVASAGTLNLDTATGNTVDVTGTTTITAITLADGRERTVRFTGALVLTNGASLVLPGSANITTVAGDVARFKGYAAGVVRCVNYLPIGATGTGSTVLAASPTFTGTPAAPTAAAGTNTTQLATTAFVTAINNNSTYRTILDTDGSHTSTKVAGTYAMPRGGQALAVSGTGTAYGLAVVQIRAADYPTVNGLTTKLRIAAQLFTNDVAPTGNFTFGLYPITRPATSGGAGVCIYTLGTVVTGSNGATFTTPAADGLLSAVGSDFALPADGPYVIGVVTTATVATNAHVQANAQLQMRNA